MNIKEVEAKSILRKYKRIDSWFISCYGMNFYRGCSHNCVYCDGRADKYNVQGEFGKDLAVKRNALDILKRELDPKRKRIPLKKSFVILGGGVGDSYQPVDEKYQLSRKALQLIYDSDFPVHILTKSVLVKRDIDLIKRINDRSRAIVSFSFSSVNDEISSAWEPGVPSPAERLETIKFFKSEGIPCGMFLLPVIPFITDTSELLEESVCKAKEAGADFIIFGGMTLKTGKQKDYFYDFLKKYKPGLEIEYNKIYKNNKWGGAVSEYSMTLNETLYNLSKKYNMPVRVPLPLFNDVLDTNDLVMVILEHIDYISKLAGKNSPYGYAANSISKLKKPINDMKESLIELKGVGKFTEKIILEILETGTSSYYDKLLGF